MVAAIVASQLISAIRGFQSWSVFQFMIEINIVNFILNANYDAVIRSHNVWTIMTFYNAQFNALSTIGNLHLTVDTDETRVIYPCSGVPPFCGASTQVFAKNARNL